MAILTVFIAGIIGIICLIVLCVNLYYQDSIVTPLIIFGICLISFISTIIHVRNIPNKTAWKETWRTNIISLKDNSNVEGHISGGLFVMSGYIGEKMHYYCMEITEDGKHMISIPANIAYIVETNDVEPLIIKKTEEYIDKRYSFWMLNSTNTKYTIYVPNGTVDTTYNIDLE